MNYTKMIEDHQLFMAVLVICAALGAGYTASDVGQPLEKQLESFDPFAYKASEDVKPYMDKVLANPTDEKLREANNYLKISVKNWESRESGENKELFHEYRIACQNVIDDMQAGKTADTSKMDEKYSELTK
jgi:hypothetical protein